MSRHGQSWTQDEEDRLVSAFDGGASIEDLVEAHQRSGGALVSRLVMHGRLADVGHGYARIEPELFVSSDQMAAFQTAEDAMFAAFDAGATVDALLKMESALGNSLVDRLLRHGCLHKTEDGYRRTNPELYVSYKELKAMRAPDAGAASNAPPRFS